MDNSKTQNSFTHREVADEIMRITGDQYDPVYIGSIRSGNRIIKYLIPIIEQAEKNLEAKGN